ncbi:MAG: transcriptional regulator PtsJ, partial [Microbacterium sp.]|nr:transcriptional regulator PtsJ [Microbacterium sp.]
MTNDDTWGRIRGDSAAEIVDSVRGLVERGALGAGDSLPPVRALADTLDLNRNTVVAAYRSLAAAGIVVTRGRGGTLIAPRSPVAQEGFASGTVLRDVGTGNPDPGRIPDASAALAGVVGRPVLYG